MRKNKRAINSKSLVLSYQFKGFGIITSKIPSCCFFYDFNHHHHPLKQKLSSKRKNVIFKTR